MSADPVSRHPGRSRFAPLVAAVALVAAGCSIPVGSPEALPRDGREDLLEGTTTTTTIVAEDETVRFRLFFIDPDDDLETIERPFVARVDINTVLRSLEQPPQPEEQPTDAEEIGLLRSLVPADLNATLLDAAPADAARGARVLQVSPEAGLRQLVDESPIQGRLVVSQVVCTFLGIAPEGTLGVEIHDDQGIIQLTDDAAQLINGPATEEDFGGCKTGTEERLELVEAGTDTTTEQDGSTTTEPGN